MKHRWKKLSMVKKVLTITSTIVMILIAGVFVYLLDYYKADSFVDEYVEQADVIIEDTNDYIIVKASHKATKGYIFYPGAKVEAKAYLPYLIDISKKADIACFVVKPLFKLAICSPNIADSPIADFPEIQDWFVGGHSLGGVIASNYVSNNSNIKGLILLAAYPDNDISDIPIPVISITGSKDKVLNQKAYQESKEKLPYNTTYVLLYGANHGQFGSYGFQSGDGKATISKAQQRAEVVINILTFINSIEH